jgi:hypothetical protein
LVAKAKTKKIVVELSAGLWKKLIEVAEQSGQPGQLLITRAVERYLGLVVGPKDGVRPAVMKHFRRSTGKNRKLHELLAR